MLSKFGQRLAWRLLKWRNSLEALERYRFADEVDQDQLEIIKSQIDDASDLDSVSEKLTPREYKIIGEFIQVYCVCDLQMRLLVDTMYLVSPERKKINARKLDDVSVREHLKRLVEKWDWGDPVDQIVFTTISAIEMHFNVRHSFAHFAASKVKGHDVFFLYSMNQNRIEKNMIDPLQREESAYVLMPISAILKGLDVLQRNSYTLGWLEHYLQENAKDYGGLTKRAATGDRMH